MPSSRRRESSEFMGTKFSTKFSTVPGRRVLHQPDQELLSRASGESGSGRVLYTAKLLQYRKKMTGVVHSCANRVQILGTAVHRTRSSVQVLYINFKFSVPARYPQVTNFSTSNKHDSIDKCDTIRTLRCTTLKY